MITTSRLQVTGVTGGPLRITGATLVNGAYELATAGGADYELQTERQTTMDNILFIPGIANPVSEINQLLFGQGQQGTFIAPSLTASLISGSTFGTGVETLPDLSPRNNPFSQATPSSRGAWFREPKTGRRNLLERTDAIGTSPWSIVGALQIDTGQAAFDGSFNAVRLRKTTTTLQAVFQPIPAGTYCNSIWLRADTVNNIAFTAGSVPNLIINLVNGIVVANTGGVLTSVTVTAFSGGWFRVSYVNANGTCLYMWPTDATSTSSFNTTSAVASVFAYFPQAELGSTATAYQRVTTAFDVTEQGQRDCFGVRADGTDDFYTTASTDFTGTDKVTVFAAVGRGTATANGVLIEASAAAFSNRAFAMLSPFNAAPANVWFRSVANGTNRDTFTNSSSFGANSRFIATGRGDISAPLAQLRVNGSVVSTITESQGTGNYGNHVLNLFRRDGTTFPFNGNLYALIVAGGSYPLSTIQRVERILSRITPTVNL
jgi:hypothetical protein